MPFQNNRRLLNGCIILGLVVVAAVVRMRFITTTFYNPDEALQIKVSSMATLAEVLERVRYETHSPLSYIIRHYMLHVSSSVIFQRLFAWIPGILVVVPAYLLGYRSRGIQGGVVLAAAMVFSVGAITYSQVTRQYALLIFLVTWALERWAAWDAEPQRTRDLFLFSALICAAGWIHYGGWFLVPGIIMAAVQRTFRANHRLLAWSQTALLAIAMGTSAAWCMTWYLTGPSPPEQGSIALRLDKLMSMTDFLLRPHPRVVFLTLMFIGVVDTWRTRRRSLLVLLAPLAIAAPLAALGLYPLGPNRQSAYALPGAAALLAEGVGAATTALYGLASRLIRHDSGRRAVHALAWLAPLLALPALYHHEMNRSSDAYTDAYEFSASNEDMLQLLAALQQPSEGDVAIGCRIAWPHLELFGGLDAPSRPDQGYLLRTYGRFQFALVENYSCTREDVRRLALQLEHDGIVRSSKLWLIELGWDSHGLRDYVNFAKKRHLTHFDVINNSGFVAQVDAAIFHEPIGEVPHE